MQTNFASRFVQALWANQSRIVSHHPQKRRNGKRFSLGQNEALESRHLLSGASMIQSAQLTLRVFDVDFNCSQGVCERDATYLNGNRLSAPVDFLTGANDQWSTVSFNVTPSFIKAGQNDVHIAIDTLDGGWCVEVDWGQLVVSYTDGTKSTFRTDSGPDLDQYDCGTEIDFSINVYEVKVKEIYSYNDILINGIDDKVYDSAAPAASNTKPIADGIKNSFSAASWDGSFSLDTHFDLMGAPADAGPFQVDYTWGIDGTSKTGKGRFAVSSTDLKESITVRMPTSVGQYQVSLDFKIRDAKGNLVGEAKIPKLRLLATLSNSLHASTNLPWLEKATEWAMGATNDLGVVTGVLNGIYTKSHWKYLDKGPSWTSLAGLGGGELEANCFVFAYAWDGLSRALGVPTGAVRTLPRIGTFVTNPATSLDGRTGNAHPVGGSTDRWVFGSHAVGIYRGVFYDPTFGTTWSGRFDSFIDAYATAWRSRWLVFQEFDAGTRTYTETLASYFADWGDWEYRVKKSPIAPGASNAPSAGRNPTFAAAPTASRAFGIDANGDGIFDQLAFDVSIDAAQAGTYAIVGTVASGGQFVTGRAHFESMADAKLLLSAAAPGQVHGTIAFSGEDIFQSGLNGPYRGTFLVVAPDGSTSTFSFDTTALDHSAFGEVPAALNTVAAESRDSDSNGKKDSLEVTVSVARRAAATLIVEAQIYSPSGVFLGIEQKQVAGPSGTEDVKLMFDGGLILDSGESGQFRVVATVFDENLNPMGSSEIQTSSLLFSNFESKSGVTGNYTDEGRDLNSNSYFDELVVGLDASVVAGGEYNVEGTLYDSAGLPIETVIANVTLTPGTNRVSLSFDGRTIYDHAMNGPYSVRYVAVSNVDVLDVVQNAFQTAAYNWQDFEPAAAATVEFTDVFSDQAPDNDNDGILDRLVISIEVLAHESGLFDMNGRLLDATGHEIQFSATSVDLVEGETKLVELSFEGSAIFANGGDGPFVLADLSTYLVSDPSRAAFLSPAYTTAAYKASDFGVPSGGGIRGQKWRDGNANGVFEPDELYMNGWDVELVDSSGNVVANATTGDSDLNGDGSIDPATERGIYEFLGISDGAYTVREVGRAGWVQTFPIHIVNQNAFDLDQQFEFRTTQNDFRDWAGLNERWLYSNNGWHYVTPAGGLFKWTSGRGTTLQSQFVAKLNPDYYNDLNLLASPAAPQAHQVTITTGAQVTGIDFGNSGASTIQGQKWEDSDADGVRDSAERFLNGWEIQLIDSATGNVVASTTTQNMDLNLDGLIDPQTEVGVYYFAGVVPGKYEVREVLKAGWIQSTPTQDLLAIAHDLDTSREFQTKNGNFLNWGNLSEKWVQANDGWYYITPDGALTKWDHSPRTALTGTKVAQLSPWFYSQTSRLTDAVDPSDVLIDTTSEVHVTGADLGNYRANGANGLRVSGKYDPTFVPGNVTVTVSRGDVRIVGDKWDNQVGLFVDWNHNLIAVGLQGTTVNGKSGAVTLFTNSATVTGSVIVELNGGDDLIALQGFKTGKNVWVNGGIGEDSVFALDLQVGGNFDVLSSWGAGTVVLSKTSIANNLTIWGSEAQDDIVLDQVVVSNRTNIQLGAAADRLIARRSVFHDDASINLGLGNDAVIALGTNDFKRLLRVNGSAGSDAASASSVPAGRKVFLGIESNQVPNLTGVLDQVLSELATLGLDDLLLN